MKMSVPIALVLGAAAVFAAGDAHDPPAVAYKNMPYKRTLHFRARPLPAVGLGPGPGTCGAWT